MSRRRWVLVISGVVIAFVIAAVAIGAALPQSTDYESYSPLVGKSAPAFSGTTLIGHKEVSLAGLRGRYVVVNFFASWCNPCAQEAPYLEQFSYDNSSSTTVVGVVFEDQNSTATNFLRQTGATYPVIGDPGEKIALAYGVKGPPETFVISPSGKVVAHVSGPVTDTGLENVLAKIKRGAA